MQKKNAGFSYVETLAASALFAIILLGVLNLILGARQNIAFARESLKMNMAANSFALTLRDKILRSEDITSEKINDLAHGFGITHYSVYILNRNGGNIYGSPFRSHEEIMNINLSGFDSLTINQKSSFILVIVLNENFVQIGRAISIAAYFCNTSGIWRNADG